MVMLLKPLFVGIFIQVTVSLSLSHTDIDECDPSGLSSDYQHLANQCHGDANCTNTKGSYNCGCQEGYYGSGKDCKGNSDLLASI